MALPENQKVPGSNPIKTLVGLEDLNLLQCPQCPKGQENQ